MSTNFIKLRGSFEPAFSEHKRVHGLAVSTGDTLRGVLFSESGTTFTIEGCRLQTATVERLMLVVSRADGRDESDMKCVMQRHDGAGNFAGQYSGRELKAGELSVETPSANPLRRLGQGISAILDISLLESATARIDLTPMSLRAVYDSLSRDGQYVADVVVLAALNRDVLGPMSQEFDFHNAVIYRSVNLRQGEVSQVPWSIPEPE